MEKLKETRLLNMLDQEERDNLICKIDEIYHRIYHREDTMWRQQAKYKWLRGGHKHSFLSQISKYA